MIKNWLKTKEKNDQSLPLFILLLAFVVGFIGLAALNYGFNFFSEKLNAELKNAQIENRIGQDIITKINEIESYFFELSAFPNPHQRQYLREQINHEQQAILYSINTLNKGGSYRGKLNLNLPHTPDLIEYFSYTPIKPDRFQFIRADMLSKFSIINQRVSLVSQHLSHLEAIQASASKAEIIATINQIKLELKFTAPFFVRLKENANQIFYENKSTAIHVTEQIAEQKTHYNYAQAILTVMALVIGLLIFKRLARNITQSAEEMALAQDYTRDILTSQSNIIVVNDGTKIIDVSGGFFEFFNGFKTLDEFTEHYNCVCDFFIETPGYIYKFKNHSWITYLTEHPNQTHKAKIAYQQKITTFQISAVKSKKYERFIISMFDITENEQINQALEIEKNRALEATQAKSDFLANMSHEIRTPMNAILGFISLLREMPHDQKTDHYLDTINSSGHSLLSIINDILDFSKIESGKLSLDFSDFNPKKEFSMAAELFHARCQEKNIQFSTRFSPSLPLAVRSDPLRLKQIVTNLLSNAVKFTERNKRIQLTLDYDPKDYLLTIRVEDQGIGISKSQQRNIFEAFTQAEASTTRKYGGTGLGLAISAKLVDLLGGKLEVESEVGEGSQFFFTIQARPVKLQPKPSNSAIVQSKFNGRILLVEDNKTNQMLMSAILKKIQIEFDIANDGVEAVDAVRNGDYQLVLMDENMPNLNGIGATKQIRELEQEDEHLPIVALTANAMSGDRERFLAAGMDEYLTKPVNIPKLIETLQEFCPNQAPR